MQSRERGSENIAFGTWRQAIYNRTRRKNSYSTSHAMTWAFGLLPNSVSAQVAFGALRQLETVRLAA